MNKVIIQNTSHYNEGIEFCYGKENVIYLSENDNIKKIEKIAKSLEEEKNVIFFNLDEKNLILMNMLPNKVTKNVIFEYSVSEFSNPVKYDQLMLILRYLDMNVIKNVYCLNHVTYELFEEKYNFKYLQLDIPRREIEPLENSIGVIGDPNDYFAGIMNEISAITLTDYKKIKILNPTKSVIKFCKRFGIKLSKENNYTSVIKGNEINLYVNFSRTNNLLILESMDRGIPCIVGNTDFFDSNKLLKEYLVMNSDDDINEIKDRINRVNKNRDIIIKEYQKFRTKYIKEAQQSMKQFLKN